MLEPRPAWPASVAQRLIGVTLQRTFERYARYVLATAIGLWLASLLLAAVGVD
jgi:hypothetical protein